MKRLTEFRLCYLATPYSKWPQGIEAAFVAASVVAARLLERGVSVYSPIAHTHPIAIHGGLDPFDHTIWLPFDAALMNAADALIVAGMLGWSESKGVAHEIDVFASAGKSMFYLNPESLLVNEMQRESGGHDRKPILQVRHG